MSGFTPPVSLQQLSAGAECATGKADTIRPWSNTEIILSIYLTVLVEPGQQIPAEGQRTYSSVQSSAKLYF